MSNCKAIIQSIILTPWVGILYPNEKIDGQLKSLAAFLAAQPKEVCEVLILSPNGTDEPRFIRSQPASTNFKKQIFTEITIY